MNDRETLELAAHACGLLWRWNEQFGLVERYSPDSTEDSCIKWMAWKPGIDNGDCADMETALEIDVRWRGNYVECMVANSPECAMEYFDEHAEDKAAARRMASLKVAAEIGKGIP